MSENRTDSGAPRYIADIFGTVLWTVPGEGLRITGTARMQRGSIHMTDQGLFKDGKPLPPAPLSRITRAP